MASRKTLHILGAGEWQLPTIRLARQLGYHVLVTDMYKERPGYGWADENAVVDIVDLEGTLQVAESHRIDGIMCDTTDAGVPTMAYVAEKLGLPGIGYETALNFTNKLRMRRLTSRAGIPSPGFGTAGTAGTAQEVAAELGFPVVIKPVDGQSSRGVHVVREPREILAAFCDALRQSREREVLIEGFVPGVEVTVEGVCVEGEVFVIGISDKDHFAHRPEVASRLTYPAGFEAETLKKIRDVNAAVIHSLGLKNGITHGEYIVSGDGVYLVEIAARGAGSRVYSHIVPFLAGAPVAERYMEFVTKGAFSVCPDGSPRAANLAFFSFAPGRVERINGLNEALQIRGVQEILLEVAVGDLVQPAQDDRSRHGLVVVFGATRSEVLAATDSVFDAVRVQTV